MTKKVLFVINTLSRAGAETALLELLGRMDLKDVSVHLFVLMNQGELAGEIPKHVKLLNHKVSQVSVLSSNGRSYMARRIFGCMLRRGTGIRCFPYLVTNLFEMLRNGKIHLDKLLWRVLADGAERFDSEYDLAVAFIEGGSAYYVSNHVKAKKKAAFIHIDYSRAGYTRNLDCDCYEDYDRIFPVSEETRDGFLKVYPSCVDKTYIFHNMLNVESIREKAKVAGGFTDQYDGFRLLTVGRLNKQKAYPVAVRTMKLLKDLGKRVKWYVLGEGEERKMLEKLIADLGLEEDFLLLGAVENPYPYFAQADLYVHATLYEGKSIAIQEAQILGCTLLVSDCPGNRQQVADGIDGIISDLSEEELRDHIVSLMEDENLRKRLGEQAKRKNSVYDNDMALLTELL